MKVFSAIARAALAPKALDGKTNELITLAISVATHRDDCVAFHAKAPTCGFARSPLINAVSTRERRSN